MLQIRTAQSYDIFFSDNENSFQIYAIKNRLPNPTPLMGNCVATKSWLLCLFINYCHVPSKVDFIAKFDLQCHLSKFSYLCQN